MSSDESRRWWRHRRRRHFHRRLLLLFFFFKVFLFVFVLVVVRPRPKRHLTVKTIFTDDERERCFCVHFFFFTGERKVCPVPPGLAFVVDEWPFFSKVVNQKRGKIFSPCSQKCQPPPKKNFLEETTSSSLSSFPLHTFFRFCCVEF